MTALIDNAMPTEIISSQSSEDLNMNELDGPKSSLPKGHNSKDGQFEEDIHVDIATINEDELFDPYCDPENPTQVKFQDVSAAAYKIKSGVLRSPCAVSCPWLLLEFYYFAFEGARGPELLF